MTTSELKSSLQKLIFETDDTNILKKVKDYFTMLKNKDVDWWDILSEKEKSEIETGINQLNEGKGIPYETVKNKGRKIIESKK